MTTYLVKVEVLDGHHLYREFGLVQAENFGRAEAKVQEQIDHDNDPNSSDRWWISADDGVKASLKGIEPIDDKDADFLQKHGIAYFINRN